MSRKRVATENVRTQKSEAANNENSYLSFTSASSFFFNRFLTLLAITLLYLCQLILISSYSSSATLSHTCCYPSCPNANPFFLSVVFFATALYSSFFILLLFLCTLLLFTIILFNAPASVLQFFIFFCLGYHLLFRMVSLVMVMGNILH